MGLPGDKGSVILDEDWVQDLETAVVFITAVDDVEVADDAFAHGAYGYMVKPYTTRELPMQVNSALRRRELENTVAYHARELEDKVRTGVIGIAALRAQVATITNDSVVTDEEVIRNLSSAIRLRDDETGQHIERVS